MAQTVPMTGAIGAVQSRSGFFTRLITGWRVLGDALRWPYQPATYDIAELDARTLADLGLSRAQAEFLDNQHRRSPLPW